MGAQESDAAAFKLVVVDWVDSRQPTSSWQHFDDIEPQSAVSCRSVGWLIQDGEALVLAQNLGDMGASPQVSGCICIPAQCVTGMQEL